MSTIDTTSRRRLKRLMFRGLMNAGLLMMLLYTDLVIVIVVVGRLEVLIRFAVV